MDWEQMKEQLQSILKTHLSITKVTEAVWNRATNESPSADSAAQSVVQENKVLFYLENQAGISLPCRWIKRPFPSRKEG